MQEGHSIVLSRKEFPQLESSIEIVAKDGEDGRFEIHEKQHLHEKSDPKTEVPGRKILGEGTFKIAKKRTKLSSNPGGYEEDAVLTFKGAPLEEEIAIMEKVKAMNSPHLLVGKVFRYTNFKGQEKVKIHQPLAEGGELYQHYQLKTSKAKPFEELLKNQPDCLRISSQFIAGMIDMHAHGQAHMDIKPENVLITGTREAKISDFGFMTETKNLSREVVGTPGYIAPEVFNRAYNPEKADVFSSGILLYEILQGGVESTLFSADCEFISAVSEGKPFAREIGKLEVAIQKIYPEIPTKKSVGWEKNREQLLNGEEDNAEKLKLARKMMILDMLSAIPEDRPSMEEVLPLFQPPDEQVVVEQKFLAPLFRLPKSSPRRAPNRLM